jgi:hypothetical protein
MSCCSTLSIDNSTFDRWFGFNGAQYAELFRNFGTGASRSVLIDNYHADADSAGFWVSLHGIDALAGVGDVAYGTIDTPVYNHPTLNYPGELSGTFSEGNANDHSGVHQWYRLTVGPNDPATFPKPSCDGDRYLNPYRIYLIEDYLLNLFVVNNSLNPCQMGWYWSLLGGSGKPFPTAFPPDRIDSSLTTSIEPAPVEVPVFVAGDTYKDLHGCSAELGAVDSMQVVVGINCEKHSSAFGEGQIQIPNNSSYLTFEYQFTAKGNGDYAAVFLDDVPVWSLTGTNLIGDAPIRSAPIPVSGLGGPHKLTIGLYEASTDPAAVTFRNFRITTVSTPPMAISQSASVTSGQSVAVSLQAVDADGYKDTPDALTYSTTQPQHGALDIASGPMTQFSGSRYSANVTYTPVAGFVGTDTFTFTASDGTATSTATVTVAVAAPNRPPVITKIADQAIPWGNVFSITAAATDLDKDKLTYSMTEGPQGAAFDPTTGSLVWTPSATDAGTHRITIQVSDGGSPILTDSTSFIVTVTKRSVALFNGGPASAQYSDAASLSASLIDNSGGALQGVPLAGKPLAFGVGSQTASATTDSQGRGAISLTLNQPASQPAVNVSFAGDALYLASSATAPFQILKESATVEYSGDTLVTTPSNATTATVSLSAIVREEADGSLGSKLGSTQLKFSVYKSTDLTMTTPFANCASAVASATPGSGTGQCSVVLPTDSYSVKIEMLDNPYYSAPVENTVLTVIPPGNGIAAGGGWLNEPNLGARSVFGFSVKYQKTGKPQGTSIYIYRAKKDIGKGLREYFWIVKSLSVDAMTLGCTAATPKVCNSSFSGKAVVIAVDRLTGIPYLQGLTYQFQADVTDKAAPTRAVPVPPDTYATRVWNAGGNYYVLGSYSGATNTGQVAIKGGDVYVKPLN